MGFSALVFLAYALLTAYYAVSNLDIWLGIAAAAAAFVAFVTWREWRSIWPFILGTVVWIGAGYQSATLIPRELFGAMSIVLPLVLLIRLLHDMSERRRR